MWDTWLGHSVTAVVILCLSFSEMFVTMMEWEWGQESTCGYVKCVCANVQTHKCTGTHKNTYTHIGGWMKNTKEPVLLVASSQEIEKHFTIPSDAQFFLKCLIPCHDRKRVWNSVLFHEWSCTSGFTVSIFTWSMDLCLSPQFRSGQSVRPT